MAARLTYYKRVNAGLSDEEVSELRYTGLEVALDCVLDLKRKRVTCVGVKGRKLEEPVVL